MQNGDWQFTQVIERVRILSYCKLVEFLFAPAEVKLGKIKKKASDNC